MIKGDYMKDRKQHVIKMAHQLFIEKGFQATSIQDILDYSRISKGTFYNYFSSKSELLIALFKSIYKKLEQDRNELLIGQDPANIEIFITQIELQMKTHRANKLISLFEEVNFSNDVELKQFIKLGNLSMLRWLYQRFIDIFDENTKPYLLDCAIMFMGILQYNLKYYALAHDSNASIHRVVSYSVNRVVKMVEEVSKSGEQLVEPQVLDSWFPDCKKTDQDFQQKLYLTVFSLKNALKPADEQSKKYSELLDFIQDELLHSKEPRVFLIESALLSLRSSYECFVNDELQTLDRLISTNFNQKED